MTELELQPRLVQISVYVHFFCIAQLKTIKRPMALPSFLLGSHSLKPTQPCYSYHHWHMKLLFPKWESVKIGRLIYFSGCLSVALFLKSTSWQLAHHIKSFHLGRANITLKKEWVICPFVHVPSRAPVSSQWSTAY